MDTSVADQISEYESYIKINFVNIWRFATDLYHEEKLLQRIGFKKSTRIWLHDLKSLEPYHQTLGEIVDQKMLRDMQYDMSYLNMARIWAQNSHCERAKVGALLIKDRQIVSDGYNGTPSGSDNCCEENEGTSKWEVLHAESNALLKCARSSQNSDGATLYVTMSPCRECSKLIIQAGIKRVCFLDCYRNMEGLEFLIKHNIDVDWYNPIYLKQKFSL